jgi:O-antigen ligase
MGEVPAREAAGAVLAGGAVVLLSFADGGFFPNAWRAGSVAFACAGGLALLAWGRPHPTRAQVVVVAALAALALWAALSALWSLDPDASLLDAQRTPLYAVAVAAALLVRGALVAGVLAGVVLVCVYSLAERLVNGPPDPPDPFEGTLLYEPLGYANGLAALAALGVALAAGLLARRPVVLVAVLAPLVATLLLTGSRGALVAAPVGAAVALALVHGRRRAAGAVATVAAAGLALALVLPAGSLAESLARHFGSRAWYWHVAWEATGASPLAGRGAGTFQLMWLERRPFAESVLDAHSLYLETLVELGLVGLVVVLVALAPPLVAALRESADPAAAGGYVAFCLHAGLDWDWELPAVTVAGLLCGCALLVVERKKVARPPSTVSETSDRATTRS